MSRWTFKEMPRRRFTKENRVLRPICNISGCRVREINAEIQRESNHMEPSVL